MDKVINPRCMVDTSYSNYTSPSYHFQVTLLVSKKSNLKLRWMSFDKYAVDGGALESGSSGRYNLLYG